MSANARTADFFVAGGTLRPDAPSYVERPADDELLDLALDGEFCYVLTPRQMGKSSLMTRTARRLRKEGVRTAVVDLTGIGTEVSAEQWYQGLITRMKTQLRLPVVPAKWWAERGALSPVQRFTDFLREVVLEKTEGPVVIFIDEVDTTLNLDFSDDFFACIRFVYNARASDPVYGRLTFVLLGVAAPADLIKDPGRTPFNIGHRIDLREFSREDARVLQRGLEAIFPEQGAAILDRVFHWTNGHPYLTQKLCLAIAEERKTAWTDARVDALVDKMFLSEETQKEANLQFVRNQILTSPQRKQLLALYRRVYRGQKIANDERSLVQSQLKLSGLVKAEDEYLQVRNEVYRRVFDSAWIREHAPVNWVPIAVGVPLLAALLAVGAILYNSWVEDQFQAHASSFLQESAPEKRLAILADMFETQNLIDPTGYYEYVARERFYGLSREEQLDLFEAESAEGADAVVVAKGLYTTLADVDGTGSTTPLLEAMIDTLSRPGSTQEAATLRAEIEAWLEGRALAGRDPGQALEAYNRAIALNGQNPSTLYERARVLIALSRYQEALDDLDRVVFIARQFEFAAVAPEATATPLPTIAPPVTTATSTSTPLPQPRIVTLNLYPGSVIQGEEVTLEWKVEHADLVYIYCGDSDTPLKYPPEGFAAHVPAQSMVYRLVPVSIVLREDGESMEYLWYELAMTRSVKVTPRLEAPTIDYFKVEPITVPRGFITTVRLMWSVSGSVTDTTTIYITGSQEIPDLDPQGERSATVSGSSIPFFTLRTCNGDACASSTVELELVEFTVAPSPTAASSPVPTQPAPTPLPTEYPLPTPPTTTPTSSAIQLPTPLQTPTDAPTPTPTSLPPLISSAFATYGQMIGAVRNLIYSSPDLVVFLTSAPDSGYTNLRESNLILTATPAPTEAPMPTPLPQPRLVMFNVYPESIIQGEEVTLEWKVEKADLVYIYYGDTPTPLMYPPESSAVHIPAQSMIYRLIPVSIVMEEDGESMEYPWDVLAMTRNVRVAPKPKAPTIDYFMADPFSVPQGTNTTVRLAWSVSSSITDTTDIYITGSQEIPDLDPQGNRLVVVSGSSIPFFILRACNGDECASVELELELFEPTPTPVPTP